MTIRSSKPSPFRRHARPIALEQRVLLDAAAMETLDAATADGASLMQDAGELADSPADALIEALSDIGTGSDAQGSVVFIDETVQDRQALVDSLPAGAHVYTLSSQESGLAQIRNFLSLYDNVSSVHIISHGTEGGMQLGSQWLDAASLERNAALLDDIRASLADSADLFLYGCDIAASSDGRTFVDALGERLGVDVAASEDVTGNVAHGGDWDLEYRRGDFQAEALFANGVQGFRQLLATGWVDGGNIADTAAAGANMGFAVAADGDLIAVAGDNNKVYTYEVDGTSTSEQIITIPTSGTSGLSLDLDGNFLVVGDRANRQAHFYVHNGTDWVYDGTVSVNVANYGWDVSVDTSGATYYAAVSALDDGEGRVYGYYRAGAGNWANAGNVSQTPGDGDDQFGYAIDIAGGRLYASAPQYDSNYGSFLSNPDNNQGRLYGFSFSGTSLSGTASVIHDGSNDWNVGRAVDASYVDGNRYVAVSSIYFNDPTFGDPDQAGRVWVYQNDGLIARIDGIVAVGGDDGFGQSVSLQGNDLLVGAPLGHGGQGWAFYYDNVTGSGTLAPTRTFGPPAGSDQFGYSVAMTGDMVVFGGRNFDNVNGADGGRAQYLIFNRTPTATPIATTTAENSAVVINLLDAPNSLNNWASQDPHVVTAAGTGQGTVSVSGGLLTYDPGTFFDSLAVGEMAQVVISYTLFDSMGESAANTVTITVEGANDPVQAGSGIDDRVDNVDSITQYAIPAGAFLDLDASDVFTYSVISVTPANGGPALSAIITNGNQVTYTPNATHQGFRYQITVRAQDPHGSFYDLSYFTDIKRSNVAPTADGNAVSLTIWEDNDVPSGQTSGLPYDMSQHFSDADIGRPAPNDSEALTYTITSGETWISVGLQDGILQASPLNQHVGPHIIEVTATDEFGLTVSRDITITVINVNDAPVQIADVPDAAAVATLNQAYSYQFDAVGGPGALFDDVDSPKNNITYSATFADGRALGTAGPGQWLHFDPVTRTFSSANGAGGVVEGDPLFTSLLVKLTATDDGNPAKSTDYIFGINVFPESEAATSSGLSGASTELGWDVAVSEDGNWMVAGEPRQGAGENYTGRVQVYNWNGSNWVAHATLNSSSWSSQAAGDRFGYSVDISADGARIVVGEPGDNNRQGRVFLFQRDGSNIYQSIQTLVGSTRDNGDEFGFDVALNHDGSRVLVGAPGDDDAGYDAGAAYVFNWNSTTALDKMVQSPDNGETIFFERFGASVAMDRNVAVIGSPYDTHAGGSFSGSATAVGVGSGGFGDSIKWFGNANQEFFGWSVSIDVFQGIGTGNVNNSAVVAIGSPNADTLAVNDGAVYTYRNDSLTTAVTAGELANFTLTATQTAYDSDQADWFGVSVAVDAGGAGDQETNGLRMAVGSRVNGSDAGSVYMHRWWAGAGWIGTRYDAVNVSTNAAEDLFGWSVSLAGQRFVAGAPDADSNGEPRGAIYSASSAGSQIENSPLSGSVTKTLASQPSVPVTDGGDIVARLRLDQSEEELLKRWLNGQLDLETLTNITEMTPMDADNGPQDLGGYVDEMLFRQRVQDDPQGLGKEQAADDVSGAHASAEKQAKEERAVPISGSENVTAFSEKLARIDSDQAARLNRMIASLESLAS